MAPSKVSHRSSATVATACSAATTAKPDILDKFREPKVCEIPPTSAQPRPDAIEELRPKPRTVLDYHISQTDIKGQRLEPTGITKLHIQQTSAQYQLPPPGYSFPVEPPPPPPPPEPIIKYSTGRGPLKEFIEDKWRRKVERQQEVAKKRLAKFIVDTRQYDKEQLAAGHAKLIKLIGPDWFQELSPQQLRTIDNLKNCIVKDVKFKTTCNTEINMAQLGLVLRPNPRHIKIALKKCCECPVEFLLILYQLLNKHRTEYSLNDRLLLSAVVHLTMRETLKELHIRIPSPPPPLQKEIPIKREKPKRYKSPYLVPFTFVPQKPKHTGIYKNNHIQYPESPYFSYISELKNEKRKAEIEEVEDEAPEGEEENRKKGKSKKKEGEDGKTSTKIMVTKKQSGITDEQEKELIGELRVAQREYNSLADYEPVPFLHKPSIYIPCDHGIKKKNKDADDESSETETNATVSVEVKVITDFDAYCQPIRKVCECRITFDETKVPKHPLDASSSSSVGLVCECAVADKPELAALLAPSAPIQKKTIAVSTVSGIEVQQENMAEKSTSMQEDTEKRPKTEPSQPPESDRKPQPKPAEAEATGEKLVTLGQRESNECKCKEEVEKALETTFCQCERCQADRAASQERKKPTYIVSGMEIAQPPQEEAEQEEPQVVAVISGVKLNKTCECMQKYQAKVKMYEEMKKRFDAQHNLKTLDQQYIIGGITQSHEGEPVYMLSGVTPERECPCAKAYQEELKEERRLANMPKIPLGRQKYIISGVHETDQGNVFVVSGAAATEDCPCLKMYKSYASKHLPCLKMYDEYLKKIELDKQEYMEEIAQDPRFVEQEPTPATNGADDGTGSEQAGLNESGITSEQRVPNDSSGSQEAGPKSSEGSKQAEEESKPSSPPEEVCSRGVVEKPEDTHSCTCCCGTGVIEAPNGCTCGPSGNQQNDLVVETNLDLTLEVNKDGKKPKDKNRTVCICEPDYSASMGARVDPTQCQCGVDSSDSDSEEEPELKRFMIMDAIPCAASKQTEIIKKALELLAADGFPLAKLPDSYKLPHFKLWMQLRCGKFWTQEDRMPLLMKSLGHWRHYGYCNRKVKLPKLNLSPEEANKYNWCQAKLVRKMAKEADVDFYRRVRQANIGDGREFFPSTFSYELPTPNFRDCYFAYTAAKEENSVCWKPWYPQEVKRAAQKKCS